MDFLLYKLFCEISPEAFKHHGKQILSRVLEGNHKFTLLLSESRKEKRAIEIPITGVYSPFDDTKFNFLKINPIEIMGYFDDSKLSILKNEKINTPNSSYLNETYKNPIIVNQRPCTPFHALYIPQIHKKLPQFLSYQCLLSTLLFSSSVPASSAIRFGFNSLSGQASVNHLHFHIFSLLNTDRNYSELPLEALDLSSLKRRTLPTDDKISLLVMDNLHLYPLRFIVIECEIPDDGASSLDNSSSQTVERYANAMIKLFNVIQARNVAHNLIISHLCTSPAFVTNKQNSEHKANISSANHQTTNGLPKLGNDETLPDSDKAPILTSRVLRTYVLLRKNEYTCQRENLNIANLEFAGYITVTSKDQFESLTEPDIEEEMRKVNLSDDEWRKTEFCLVHQWNEI